MTLGGRSVCHGTVTAWAYFIGMIRAAPEPEIPPDATARRAAMTVLAMAESSAIEGRLLEVGAGVEYTELRRPEIGLVMLRGRMNGAGAPFNLGEATVTRAVVRLASGETGFSYVLGRDGEKARAAALVDALWQRADLRPRIEELIIAPLRMAQEARDQERAQRTAATKVDFFTLVRGED